MSILADPPPSPGAARQRLYRDRRKKRLRCVTIELRDSEIAELIRRGYLMEGERGDKYAVRKAVHALLDCIFPHL